MLNENRPIIWNKGAEGDVGGIDVKRPDVKRVKVNVWSKNDWL